MPIAYLKQLMGKPKIKLINPNKKEKLTIAALTASTIRNLELLNLLKPKIQKVTKVQNINNNQTT